MGTKDATALIEAIDVFLLEQRRTRRERSILREEQEIRGAMREGFREQERLFLLQFIEGTPTADVDRMWSETTSRTFDDMAEPTQSAVEGAFTKGAQVLRSDLIVNFSFELTNPRALFYVEQYGANLVTNINETTRRQVRRIISNGINDGTSYSEIRQRLREKFKQFHTPKPQLHIRDRAELIAVTEMGNAYEAGSQAFAREAMDLGLRLEKSWLTAGDDRVDDVQCRANSNQGWIPFTDSYTSGDMRPLAHPACRCTQLTRRFQPEGI